jgi:hypothetical protein
MARRCAEITAGCGDAAADFDHVYAAEAEARALACLGRGDEATAAYGQAAALLEKVSDPEDRKIAESDLLSGPWFGLSRPD